MFESNSPSSIPSTPCLPSSGSSQPSSQTIIQSAKTKKRVKSQPKGSTKKARLGKEPSIECQKGNVESDSQFSEGNTSMLCSRPAVSNDNIELLLKNAELSSIGGRQTGVKKIQARLSSLEKTLAEIIPTMLNLASSASSQTSQCGSEATSSADNSQYLVSRSVNNQALVSSLDSSVIDSAQLIPPNNFFLEYDYSHHLIALYFTIHEYTGQEPAISRRDFFDSLPSNQIPTFLVHAMFAFSSRYSNHPAIFSNCLQFSKTFSKNAALAASSSFSKPTIRSIQALLLLSYLGIQRGNPSTSWGYLGAAVRISQLLGIDSLDNTELQHLPSTTIHGFDPLFLKKIWHLCCSTDTEVSMLLDKPRLTRNSYPTLNELREGALSISLDQYVLSCVSVLPTYLASCLGNTRTIFHLWKKVEDLYSNLDPNQLPQDKLRRILSLGSTISTWHLSLPSQLAYCPDFFHPQVSQRFLFLEQIISLHIVFCRLKLLLFQPVLENFTEFQSCQGFAEIKKEYTQSALFMLRILEDWNDRNLSSDGQIILNTICEKFEIFTLTVDPVFDTSKCQNENPPFLPTHFFFAGLAFLLTLNSESPSSSTLQQRRLKLACMSLIDLLNSISDWDGATKISEKLRELAGSINLVLPQ